MKELVELAARFLARNPTAPRALRSAAAAGLDERAPGGLSDAASRTSPG